MTRRSTASPAMARSTAPKATATVRGRGHSTWTAESGWESNTESKSGNCTNVGCSIIGFTLIVYSTGMRQSTLLITVMMTIITPALIETKFAKVWCVVAVPWKSSVFNSGPRPCGCYLQWCYHVCQAIPHYFYCVSLLFSCLLLAKQHQSRVITAHMW